MKKIVFVFVIILLTTGYAFTQSDQELKNEITKYIEKLNFENNFQRVTLSKSMFPKNFGYIFIYPIKPEAKELVSRVGQRLNYGVGSNIFPKQKPGDNMTSLKNIIYIDSEIIILWDTQGI